MRRHAPLWIKRLAVLASLVASVVVLVAAGLVLAAGEELQVPLPIASLLRDRFLTLLANGGGQLDWAAVGALSSWEAGGKSPVG